MKAKLPNHPSDEKLVAAAEKIKAVLREYDCAGIVTLASGNGHSEFVNFIEEPTWSCVKFEGFNSIRVKAAVKSAPAEERVLERIKLQKTINMIILFRETLGNQYTAFYQLSDLLHKTMSIEESGTSAIYKDSL